MSISLDKFVNVNLVHHESSVDSTTRDTVVLLSGIDFDANTSIPKINHTADDGKTKTEKTGVTRAFNSSNDIVFTSLPEYPDIETTENKTITKYYSVDVYGDGSDDNPYKLPFPYSFFYYISAIDESTETITLKIIDNLKPIYQYLKVFFDNAGVKAKLMYVDTTNANADMSVIVSKYVSAITSLDDKYILVDIIDDTIELNNDNTKTYRKSLPLNYRIKIAKKLDTLYYGTDLTTAKGTLINVSGAKTKSGIHRKLLLGRIRYTDIHKELNSDDIDTSISILSEKFSSKSLILKYASCKTVYDENGDAVTVDKVGDEMSIAAYLTRININSVSGIKDYCYTVEVSTPDVNCYGDDAGDFEPNVQDSNHYESKEIDDDMHDILKGCHFTFTHYLANNNRAIGGDTTAGYSFVNEYVSIIVHQTVTNALITLLASKPDSTNICGQINSVISSDLNKYISNGYLTTNKTWSDDTLTVTKNGVSYEIIASGTQLPKGYYVTTLPLSSLTATEKKNHKAPTAYVILAESDAIRTIDVVGEII